MDDKVTLLWLDDYRDPTAIMSRDYDYQPITWSVFSPIEHTEIVWVKSYIEFVNWIEQNGLPNAICFDYDLGEEKSGYDCAKWLVNYCLDNNKQLPLYNIQSANPIGRENIDSYLKSFLKTQTSGHI